MKNTHFFAPVLASLILVSCGKEVTRTCTCKSAYGKVLSTSSRTSRDKQMIAEFEEACRKDGIMSTETSGSGPNAVTTSTYVPCTLE